MTGFVFNISLAAEWTAAWRRLGVEAETSWEVLEAEQAGVMLAGAGLEAVGVDSGKHTGEQESQTRY